MIGDLQVPFEIRKFSFQGALDGLGELLERLDDKAQAVLHPLCLPGGMGDAVDEHHRTQQAAARMDPPGVSGGDCELPLAIAEKIWVVGGQQVDDAIVRGRFLEPRELRLKHRKRGSIGAHLDQVVFDLVPGGPNARLTKSRPSGQIVRSGGAVSRQISARQLRLRLFRTGLAAGRYPIFEQDIGRFAVQVRAEADHPLQAGKSQEVIDGLAFGEYVATLSQAGDLGSRFRFAAREDFPERFKAFRGGLVVQSHLTAAPAAGRGEDRPMQGEEPRYVLCRKQMKRAAHTPGPHDRAFAQASALDVCRYETTRARAQRQSGGRRVLGLDGAERAYCLGDRLARTSRLGVKPLGAEAQPPDFLV